MKEAVKEAAWQVIAAGRKFEDRDVTFGLAQAACEYAASYGGTFGFMVDMKKAACTSGLSAGQVRGVLNCLLVQVKNELPAEMLEFKRIATLLETARQHLKWPKIRLQTTLGQQVFIGLAGPDSKEPGSVVVTYKWPDGYERQFGGRISHDGTFRGSPPTDVKDVLKELAEDPERVATEYGRLTGNCCFCGSGLIDERSTVVGYGPVCAKHFGLAWGRKAA